MSEQIIIERADGVLTLTLNRPDKKNALTDAMYGALADALEASQDDPAIRVIAIRGEGELFCAGNDIGDFLAAAGGDITQANVFRFIRLLAQLAKPLIAGVQGPAVGIGTTMLLHCDYVILADDAKLSTPFVSLGLVPEAASSLLLPRRIGHPRAFAMLAMGEKVEASEAVQIGLANEVVSRAQLDQALHLAAARIAKLPPSATQATKALMQDKAEIDAKIVEEIVIFAERMKSPEATEAFAAFMEKRAPDFSKFS
ncbi:MAG: enoyl-CoA hydratase [Alteraurantiacibacter sp. bin_em_oilr2.035]|nr:enoyl-CoA hydratase [Alteraurantiacibacter sp. bin_em_oilr2.035]